MSSRDDEHKREIEREARAGKKPSLAEQIGKEAAGALKGASPVAPLEQAINELCLFVREQMQDPSGALVSILQRRVRTSEPLVDRYLHRPLAALRTIVEGLTENELSFAEFVREVDVRWGQLMDEKPHFEMEGRPPHREDEYTHGSVRAALKALEAAIERGEHAS